MNKKGISAVVATVLIILVTIAGVAVIWAAVIPMIRDSLEFPSLSGRVSVLSSGGYTVYDAEKKVAMVQVKREVDEGVMNRIRVSFSVGGNSVSSSVIAPGSGQTKVYAFDLSSYGVPDSVGVSPIFVAKSGKEKEGSVTSEVDLSTGRIGEVPLVVYGVGGGETRYLDDSEYSVVDDAVDSEYKLMKSVEVPVSSDVVNVKFSGYIQSGGYYWSWKITKNGGTALALAEGGVAQGSFASHLDTGETSAVHSYRRFSIDVQGLEYGDLLELWMVSSTAGGLPVNGNGQILYVKDFEVSFD